MPTLTVFDGFEHETLSTAGGGLYSAITGTPAINGTAARSGGFGLALTNSEAVAYAISGPIGVAVVYFQIPDLGGGAVPPADAPLFAFLAGSREIRFGQDTSGQLWADVWTGAASSGRQTRTGALVADTWYRIEARANSAGGGSSDTFICDWAVALGDGDATAQTQVSVVQVAGQTWGTFRPGIFSASEWNMYVDDVAVSLTSGDYPLGPEMVLPEMADGVGTHNLDASPSLFFFKDDNSTETAITSSETNSWEMIDEWPVETGAPDRLEVKGSAGTAPTLQAEGATNAVTTGNNSPVIPTHQADDIIVVAATYWGPVTAGDAAQIPTPADYTLIGTQIPQPTAANRDGWLAFFWRRVTGAGTTVTLTRGASWDTGNDTCFGARAYVIRGCITTGDPWDEADPTPSYTTANQPFDAVTVSGNTRTVIQFGASMDNQAFAMTATGWTTGTEDNDPTGTDCAFQTARKDNVSTSTAADTPTVSAPAQGGYGFMGISFKPPVANEGAQPAADEYLEHTYGDTAETGTILAVRAIDALRNDSGTTANSITGKIAESGSEANIYSALDIASASNIYKTAVFNTKPSGGAWTAADVNELVHRWGFTTDTDSTPRLEAIMLEVIYIAAAAAPVPRYPAINHGNPGIL